MTGLVVENIKQGVKMKHMRKLTKKGVAVLAILLIAGVTVSATAFTYFMNTQSQHSVGKLWQISDNSTGSWSALREMGDDDITFDTTTMVGGDMEQFYFTINLSGNSNANRDIVFNMTNAYVDDGVTFQIIEIGADEVTNLEAVEWAPNTEKTFAFVVSLDEYTPEGSYTVSLNLEKN